MELLHGTKKARNSSLTDCRLSGVCYTPFRYSHEASSAPDNGQQRYQFGEHLILGDDTASDSWMGFFSFLVCSFVSIGSEDLHKVGGEGSSRGKSVIVNMFADRLYRLP